MNIVIRWNSHLGMNIKMGLWHSVYKRGSFHDIVNVPECQIVDEDFRKILTCTLACASERTSVLQNAS